MLPELQESGQLPKLGVVRRIPSNVCPDSSHPLVHLPNFSLMPLDLMGILVGWLVARLALRV